ncbi:MAG: hypothetical protein WB781_05455 [Candidatus Sulfotelmatobacter sp.]
MHNPIVGRSESPVKVVRHKILLFSCGRLWKKRGALGCGVPGKYGYCPTPALCKVREGRGTNRVGIASEIKSLGHPFLVGCVNPRGTRSLEAFIKWSYSVLPCILSQLLHGPH